MELDVDEGRIVDLDVDADVDVATDLATVAKRRRES